MKASWTKISQSEPLQRSSHNIAAAGGNLYIFGGELKPRQPRDNVMYTIQLDGNDQPVNLVNTSNEATPTPRVGSAVATIGSKLYFFSGRGGEAMTPIDEKGALWAYDSSGQVWELISPSSNHVPQPRSYHATTSDGNETIYIHAGCPEKGRLPDLWSFNINSKEWKELAAAPDPARGGPSIAFASGKLYRMNGFDGNTEQGGTIDVYDPKANEWSSVKFAADGKEGPGARSVAVLLPVSIEDRKHLVTLFGESDPSSLGHQGAGKMLSDVWAYDIESGKWAQVETTSGGEDPAPRGWFDADTATIAGKPSIVVAGGLGETNERLDDVWLLNF
ncbi:galactose oxidase [Polychaeton citri CBS 116435]|uniref:Galactose oxidase n=1 Tax=Polychaeton citri CBS 116435 TaxID=1314669 RepID=A0A9P4Q808_9PEZI|nr:galactose oxidase [Polychaeton citri CBS 116435]